MTITRVYAKGGRWYYVQDLGERNSRTGRLVQKWHKLTRVDEGDAALAELLGDAPERRGNMKALIDEFEDVHFAELTVGVRKEYERMFNVIGEAFAEFDAAQVQPGDVIKFLADNFAQKPTARRHYKARLSTFFSWCVLNSHTGVKVNPCREVKVSAPPRRKGRMTPEIFWKIRDALPLMGQCFLDLTFLTRQRPTEIRLLRESQIGPERIRFVPTKTADSSGEEVEVVITPEIQAAIERARELRRARNNGKKVVELRGDEYVIQTQDGSRFTKTGLFSMWHRACGKVGVTGVTTRDIRAFALSTMEKLGYEIREIQKAAAHTSITTTEGYLDQYRERVSAARLELPQKPVR